MSLTLTPDLSSRMTEALVAVAATEKFGTRNFLPNFRTNTIVGLLSRGYIDTTETGYVLTIEGKCYLIEKSLGIWGDNNELLIVQTTYISGEKRREVLRDYHLQLALKRYKGRLMPVTDSGNNVNRRCNIVGNGDKEMRQWQILSEVNFVKNPHLTTERLYLLMYVGKEDHLYYHECTSPYIVTTGAQLTNLY